MAAAITAVTADKYASPYSLTNPAIHGIKVVTETGIVIVNSNVNCSGFQVTTATKTSRTTLVNGCSTIPNSATEGKISISGCPSITYDNNPHSYTVELLWAKLNDTHGRYAKGKLDSLGLGSYINGQPTVGVSGTGTVYNVTVAPFNKLVC